MESEGVSRSVSEEGWQPPLFAASTWTLIITAISLFFVYDYSRRRQYLACNGIAGPKAKPFVGNLLDMIFHKDGIRGFYGDIIEKYGKVAGCYMGAIPTVVIGDVEWVQQLCIKDFSSFVNLKPITVDSKPFHKSLPTLRDSHWKDVRGIVSPTFSGSKMKQMAPIINDCLDPMIRKVIRLNQEGKGLEFKEVYSGFLIDAIGSTAFGLTLNSQENSDDPFLHNARDVIKFRFSIAFLVKMLAPILSPVVNFFNLTTFNQKTLKFFEDVLDHAVELKRAGTVKRVDFLQLMLDAQERTEDDKAEATEEEKQEEEHRAKMSKKTLTADEIKSQGLLFFLAGFETSGTTLGFASYLLATNPEIQDKLVAEIDTLAPSRDDVTYENLTKLTYLDWVISETLRLYPPGFLTTREAGCEYKHKGYTIPKGVQVHFDVWHIHHDPEHWEDPDKFNPERFSPEQREKRHPCAFLPFGAGPRSCIGMRFALLQVKMALVRMLQNFHLETCEETEIPPVLTKAGSLSPAKGFRLAAVPRS